MIKIKQNCDLILASSSKVRKEILNDLGFKFKAMDPDFDEEGAKAEISNLEIKEQAAYLAKHKAKSISIKHKDALVIGSDQICAINSETISKPKTQEEAFLQLSKLNGKIHNQNNAVSIFKNGEEIFSCLQIATIKMRILQESEIRAYIKLDNPVGCAGSYKIESFGRHLFQEIDGDIFCIAGISIQPVLNFLHQSQYIELE